MAQMDLTARGFIQPLPSMPNDQLEARVVFNASAPLFLFTSLFATATALSVMRWAHAYHLFAIGAFALTAAIVGREARRRRVRGWVRLHIVGMTSSYVLMLVAFYVDNGKQLPPLSYLPPWTYWALPLSISLPIILWALVRHPPERYTARRASTA
jgi:hypothetical protein